MKTYNITAQVYKTNDPCKQTILFNQEVYSDSPDNAKSKFTDYHLVPYYILVKIYSVEEIVQVCS